MHSTETKEYNKRKKSAYLTGLFFLVFFLGLFSLAESSWAGTITATSCSYENVSAVIATASPGDTVIVPAGNCSWNNTLLINKEIHIKGAGAGLTTLKCAGGNDLFNLNPLSGTNPEMEISGFTIDASGGCYAIRLGPLNVPSVFMNRANIHDNNFVNIVVPRAYFRAQTVGGVIWKNTFTGNYDFLIESVGPGNGTHSLFDVAPNTWNGSGGPGSSNAIFSEDNVITMTSSEWTYMTDCQYGGMRRVWRYNTISNNSTGQIIDFHGYCHEEYLSCYGDEFYGNRVVQTSSNSFGGFTASRGGKALLYYNDVMIDPAKTASTGNVMGYRRWCPDAYGHGEDQNIREYAWNNRRNTNTQLGDVWNNTFEYDPWPGPGGYGTCDGLTNEYPKENYNYFNFKPSFDGSAGTGCGSALPNPNGFTEKVGYWLTNQSCSNVNGITGDIMNNPSRAIINGDLYKIQSGQWVKIYTPYAYPHPLRNESDSDTTPPAAPSGLSVD